MGGGEAAIGVDTVSPGMIRNRTTVDSGGNVGLPGRQALHTQASSATLSQQPHPPREVDATWHLPPVFIFRAVRQWVWIHEDTGRPASHGGASQKFNGSGPVIDEAAPEKLRSLSASRARQTAAGKEKRGTPCGVPRDSRLQQIVRPQLLRR